MKAVKIKKTPSCAGLLKGMIVGEVKVIKLTGRVYNAFLTARGRMRTDKTGNFLFQCNDDDSEMTITRTA